MQNDNNFYVQAYSNGGMQSFEVIPQESKFGIAQNGAVIAEIAFNEAWEQVSGDLLDEDIIETIGQAIDEKYD